MKIKREKSTSTKGHYVRNADLLPAVIEAKSLGKVTNKLIGMIQMIAERYSRKHNFVGYPFREDMVASAVSNLYNNALKFNPDKSQNPFSFYTTAIHNSFLQYMADEKKHRNIKDKLIVQAGANPSFSYADKDKEDQMRMSDDREIGSANHLEDASKAPALLPYQSEPGAFAVGIFGTLPGKNPSYSAQAYSSLDPGAPGKKRLSRFADLNPGEVKVYKPSEYEYDPETGSIKFKTPVEKVAKDLVEGKVELGVSPRGVGVKKKKSVAKKAPKKTVARKVKTKASRKAK